MDAHSAVGRVPAVEPVGRQRIASEWTRASGLVAGDRHTMAPASMDLLSVVHSAAVCLAQCPFASPYTDWLLTAAAHLCRGPVAPPAIGRPVAIGEPVALRLEAPFPLLGGAWILVRLHRTVQPYWWISVPMGIKKEYKTENPPRAMKTLIVLTSLFALAFLANPISNDPVSSGLTTGSNLEAETSYMEKRDDPASAAGGQGGIGGFFSAYWLHIVISIVCLIIGVAIGHFLW